MSKSEFFVSPDFSKIRLLFLDVDGVLNSRKTVLFAKRWPDVWEEHEVQYKKCYIRNPEAFDKYSIQLINKLCEVTETFIVISSSWRKVYSDFNTVLEMFKEMGIDTRYIIGRTDDINVPHMNRGAQIKRFCEMLQRGPEDRKFLIDKGLLLPSFQTEGTLRIQRYVIVDDMDGEEVFSEQKPYLVKTDDYEGLTLRDTLGLGEILTGNEAFCVKNLQTGNPGFVFK